MFNRPGNKLKGIAYVLFVLIVIASIFYAVIAYKSTADGFHGDINKAIFTAALIIVAGFVLAYLSTIALVGFGQLIDNSDKIVEMLSANSVNAEQKGRDLKGTVSATANTNSEMGSVSNANKDHVSTKQIDDELDSVYLKLKNKIS